MNITFQLILAFLLLNINVSGFSSDGGHVCSVDDNCGHEGCIADLSLYYDFWHLDRVNAQKAWEYASTDNEVVIGVCDTGIDASNDFLSSKIDRNLSKDFTIGDVDRSLFDAHGHGTHVAGTIAGLSSDGIATGVASYSNVKLVSLKVFDDGGFYTTSDALPNAIKYAQENGIQILNISGSCGNTAKLREAIEDYSGTIIAAAGNIDGNYSCPFYPAAYDYDNVVSVGATDFHNDRAILNDCIDSPLTSETSNYGDFVDIYAPGRLITSASSNDQTEGLESRSGTSMAAPLVTGTVAMMLSLNNSLTSFDITDILYHSASTIYVAGYFSTDESIMLDAGLAVSRVAFACSNGVLTDSRFDTKERVTIPSAVFDDAEKTLVPVDKIGSNLFGNNDIINIIEIEAGVGLIGDGAFEGCNYLSKVYINDRIDLEGSPFDRDNESLEICIPEIDISYTLANPNWFQYFDSIRFVRSVGDLEFEGRISVIPLLDDNAVQISTMYIDDYNQVGFLGSGVGIVGYFYSTEYFAEVYPTVNLESLSAYILLININIDIDNVDSYSVVDENWQEMYYFTGDQSIQVLLNDASQTFYIIPSDVECDNITFYLQDISVDIVQVTWRLS